MRIYLVTANAQDHNEYIEYRDQPYNPDSFTDTPMHMGETSYTAGFVSIMGVYTTREQAETRVNKLTREKFPDLRIIEIEADSDCWQFVGGGVGSGEQANNHSGPSERHALGQANHHQQLAWHRRVRQAERNQRRLRHHAQFGVLLPLQRKQNIGVQ